MQDQNDTALRQIMEAAPVNLMEEEDAATRAEAAKRGWDRRGRSTHGHRAKSGHGGHISYVEGGKPLAKGTHTNMEEWKHQAEVAGHKVRLASAGKYQHRYVAVDKDGKTVGHFNHDQTPAHRHFGTFY